MPLSKSQPGQVALIEARMSFIVDFRTATMKAFASLGPKDEQILRKYLLKKLYGKAKDAVQGLFQGPEWNPELPDPKGVGHTTHQALRAAKRKALQAYNQLGTGLKFALASPFHTCVRYEYRDGQWEAIYNDKLKFEVPGLSQPTTDALTPAELEVLKIDAAVQADYLLVTSYAMPLDS